MTKINLTSEQREEFKRLYPHQVSSALVGKFGYSARQLNYIARRMGLRKTPELLATLHANMRPKVEEDEPSVASADGYIRTETHPFPGVTIRTNRMR